MVISGFKTIEYEDGRLSFLDQTLLPNEEKYIEIKNRKDVYEAIKRLAVRGAPAIGVGAAYGMLISVEDYCERENPALTEPLSGKQLNRLSDYIDDTADYLISSRPTAVNLEWAVKRVREICINIIEASDGDLSAKDIIDSIKVTAERIMREDRESCMLMGEYGLSLLKPGFGILTHCNAGALATTGYGTALAPIHMGQERGYGFHVFVDETRPLLQGARLTAWELVKSGVDVTLICDNMASIVMKSGKIDAIVVGCDRLAANGDGANKIGTSGVAMLAKEYGIPFYMFVPTSTIDMGCASGDDIVIEERRGDEIGELWYEKTMAPEGVKTYNPAFDVTDHRYITAVVTEKGIVYPPFDKNLAELMGGENIPK